jgi:alpha-N-arabinofuranosidase
LAFGWNKGTIGGHIVRNNTIAYCEQTGIVGSMGCSFSTIEGNVIHDIHIRRLFSGAEMAGIKFHGAVDVTIKGNHIYRANMGVWLDWMAQGVHVSNNLMHDNLLDIFLEVDHGPMLVDNNVLLSKTSLLMNSSGAAFVHNIFGGKMDVINYDNRLTPYHKPHSTFVAGLHDNPGGDIRFINNLFVNGGNASQYAKAILPVSFEGNVFTKGSIRPISENLPKKFGEMSETAKEKIKSTKDLVAIEKNTLDKRDFEAMTNLVTEKEGIYLEIALDKKWLTEQKRNLVTSKLLGKAIIPDLLFENVDGSKIVIDTDYFGEKRNTGNPSPGPFEIKSNGKQKIKIW